MKIAVFVDWENLRKDIENIQRNHKEFKEKFNYNNAKQVANLIKSFIEEDEKLYRVFFYTAQPLDLTIRQRNSHFKWLGELQLQGKDDRNKLIISQKQVDMLLGLDISHIAYNKLVDSILVFCKDSDMLPALKCARINGLNVFIAHIENGFKITEKLKIHSDKIRVKSIESILKNQYQLF